MTPAFYALQSGGSVVGGGIVHFNTAQLDTNWVVQVGVTSATFYVAGAGAGGDGGEVRATLTLPPLDQMAPGQERGEAQGEGHAAGHHDRDRPERIHVAQVLPRVDLESGGEDQRRRQSGVQRAFDERVQHGHEQEGRDDQDDPGLIQSSLQRKGRGFRPARTVFRQI